MIPILVVDDDPAFFQILEGLLLEEPLSLSYLRDSTKALAEISEVKPHVILTDLMMPKKNGMELCRELKSNPECCHIPIILLTSLDDEHFLSQCLEAGADDFLNKDVSGCELRARVRSMLRIRRQYDELRRSVELREDVAHMIVHDLGNPLGTILLEIDDLMIGEVLPQQVAALEKIRHNTQRLHSMSHDMLMLAKMEHGKLRLDLRVGTMGATVQEAVANLSSQARRRRIVVEVESKGESASFLYDQSLMLRVVENLLSNAIKFSPAESRVVVRVLASPLQVPTAPVRIELQDQGPGVPEDLKEKVFDKFEVVKMSRATSQVGLGLAFCRMAVEAHGGKIGVVPAEPKGSIFWFEIPEVEAPLPEYGSGL